MQQLSFRIDCLPSKQEEVLQLLESLLKLGAIRGYSKNMNWIDPKEHATEDDLLQMVQESKKQAEAGQTYSTDEAKAILKKWQQEKQ